MSNLERNGGGIELEEQLDIPEAQSVTPPEKERTLADDMNELAELQGRLDRGELNLESPEFDRYATLKAAAEILKRPDPKVTTSPRPMSLADEVEAASNFRSRLTPEGIQPTEPGDPAVVEQRFQEKLAEFADLKQKPFDTLTPAEQQRWQILEKISQSYAQYKGAAGQSAGETNGAVRMEGLPPAPEMKSDEEVRQERLAEDVARLRNLSDAALHAMHEVNLEAMARLTAQGRGEEIEGRLTKETLDAYNQVLAERGTPAQGSPETATGDGSGDDEPLNLAVERVGPTAIVRRNVTVVERFTPVAEPKAVETEDAPETSDQPEPLSVDEARAAYAEALHKRTKIFGKTSDTTLEQTAAQYQEALAREHADKISSLQREFEGKNLEAPEVQGHLRARMVEILLTDRQAEENALRESMMEIGERSLFGKFKQQWKKHAKLRLAGSLALMGVSGVSLATGNLALFAGSQALRTGLSGVGSGMAAESGMDFVRDRWGDTKKLSADQMKEMDQGELERRLAGHTIRTAELGQGKEGKPLSETAQLLQQEYMRRNSEQLLATITEQLQAGKNWSEVAGETFSASLKDQVEFHRALETRRDQDRKHKLRKLATALGAGATVGVLMGISGAEKASDLAANQAQHALEQGGAVADHTAVVLPNGGEHIDSLRGIGADLATQHEAVEVVQKGDNVWNIVERELHERMGASFDQLDEARKTYMIDALKDKIAADPSAFGLHDVDHLNIGDKVDMTKLFEGQDAVPLDGIRVEALNLDQGAVESILKNNELLRDWVTSHPHEALDSAVAERVLQGELPASVAETSATAAAAGAELNAHAHEVWVQQTHEAMMKRLLCNLSEQFPEEYAKAHAANPDLYPDIAGNLPDHETVVVHLTETGVKALGKYHTTMEGLYSHTNKESADAIAKTVGNLRVDQAAKSGVVERMVDEMEGGTAKTAKQIGRTLRGLLKTIPKGEYLNSEKVSDVIERLPKTS